MRRDPPVIRGDGCAVRKSCRQLFGKATAEALARLFRGAKAGEMHTCLRTGAKQEGGAMNAVTDFHPHPSMGDGLRSFIDDPTRSVHFRAADAEHRAGPAGFRLPAR